jgi:DHA1 family tetracycline resistance protein-like MFS transporter
MNSRLIVIFLTVFIDLLGFGIVIPILPNYVIHLGANTFVTGLIAGSFSLMNFLMTSYLGAWSDKIGRRPVLMFTVLMNALSYLLLAFSNQLWMIFLSRIIAGIGSANISVAQAYIADITPPEQRTKRMALIGMAFGLGFVLGPPIGGYLKSIDEQHGIVYVGIFNSFLCFINLFSAFFLLNESLKERDKNKQIAFTPIQNIRNFIAIPVIKEYLWYGFIFISALSIFQVLSTVYWKEHCLLKDYQIGWFFGFIGIVSILWQTIGLKLLLKKYNERSIIIAASALMSMSIFCLIFLNDQNVLYLNFVLLFFISMGNGLISPSITSLLSQRVPPQQSGSLLGVFQSLNSLARAVAPAVGGFLYDINEAYPFILASVVMISSVYLIKKVRQNF